MLDEARLQTLMNDGVNKLKMEAFFVLRATQWAYTNTKKKFNVRKDGETKTHPDT